MTTKTIHCIFIVSLLWLLVPLPVATNAQQGTRPLQTISAKNAHRLQPLATLGGNSPTALAWSSRGDRLLVATLSGVWLYENPLSAPVPRALAGYDGRAWDVAFSPDDNAIAVAGNDGSVRLWTAASPETARILQGHTNSVWRVVFSPDGKTLVSASWDGTVRWWDVQSGQEHTARRLAARGVNDIAFSPEGELLAIAYTDGRAQLWATNGDWQAPHATFHYTESITNLAFGPQGNTLIGGSVQGAFVQWNTGSGERLTEWSICAHGTVTDVAIASTGALWATACEDGTVHLRKTTTSQAFRVFKGHTSSVLSLAFDPRGTVLASASYDGTVRFWDTHTGDVLTALYVGGHTGPVLDVAFSADGAVLASSSADGTVRLWAAESAIQQRQFTANAPVSAVAFSSRGDLLASAGWDGTVRLWDAKTGASVAMFTGHSDWVVGLAFDTEGTQLASAGWDGTVRLWQGNTAAKCEALVHDASVVDVAFVNRQRLASVDINGAVYLWDVGSCARITGLPPVEHATSVAASPGGRWLAIGTADGNVQLWDTNVHVVATIRGEFPISAMAFSSDSSLLVVAEENGTVRVEVPATGETVATFEQVAGRLHAVAISPNGRHIAFAGEDPALQIWGVPAEEE